MQASTLTARPGQQPPAAPQGDLARVLAMEETPRLPRTQTAPDLRLLERLHEEDDEAEDPEQVLAGIEAWLAATMASLEHEEQLEQERAPQLEETREGVESAAELLRSFDLSDWAVARPRYGIEPERPRTKYTA